MTQNFEIVRLIAQLVGALLIAWLAVRWALSRYKSEKVWERSLEAYSEILSLLVEIRGIDHDRLTMLQEADVYAGHPQASEFHSRLSDVQPRLQKAVAKGRLLLPERAQAILIELSAEFDRQRSSSDLEHLLNARYVAVGKAMTALIDFGRGDLSIDSERHG
ncbi:hypothetical protein E3U23_11105 [Erythrobacter litoralis]|uniref:hypothetical protein n=1 Tax=Erythrobacter litoralis TaxID=39960 RepID=UPI002435872C|nr:hypothetical protein [Erythrobacter litoralis]MDG6079736.1 hypothetical protein [Erythrobacter litoralis]